jgi:histidine triad (HIT) family protein
VAKPCIFCEIIRGAIEAQTVLEEAGAVAFLDHRPLFKGHVLLVPRPHLETLADLPGADIGPFFAAAQRLSIAVRDAMGAQGTFVAMNNAVSQSVPHLHVHIVPRTKGDGLKGFFWPRHPYASREEMAATAERIREALAQARL